MITFDNTITLIASEPINGRNGSTDARQKVVRGHVELPSMTLQNNMAAMGKAADLAIYIYRKELDIPYSHVEILGTRYRIESISRTNRERIARLTVSRGL